MRAKHKDILTNTLDDGEKLLWSGQPRQGIFLTRLDFIAIPFSIMWGGFAIFWEFTVVTTDAPLLFKLWGIPFVIAGIHIMVGRFFIDAIIRSKTFYGITNQRIIIISGLFSKNTSSLTIKLLPDILLEEVSPRYGSIYFKGRKGRSSFFRSHRNASPRFEYITDARETYNLIRKLAEK